jgi:hypothetical protein
MTPRLAALGIVIALIVSAFALTVGAPPAAAGLGTMVPPVTVLHTTLTGAAEVPGPGDPDGRGTATIVLIPFLGRICYALTAQNIAPATAAHIHVGSASVAGPVVVSLAPPTNGASGGCVNASPLTVAAIAANPANYYVNVHNPPFPAGAIRGQLG